MEPNPRLYAGDARRARQPPKTLVFDKNTFGFVTRLRRFYARRYRRGHVAQRIVLGVDTLHAQLEFIRVRCVVQRFFHRNEPRRKQMEQRLIERLHAVL